MRSRMRTPVVGGIAALAVAAVGLVGATGAAAEPGSTVELAPGVTNASPALVTDDAVYVADASLKGPVPIYRRTLTGTGAELGLGALQQIANTAPFAQLAELDGRLAYVRAADGRVALRAPDGTETVIDVDDPPVVAGGVHALTSDWLVGMDEVQLESALVNRSTGAVLDLAAVPGVPEADGGRWQVGDIELDGSRAVFSVEWDGAYAPGRQVAGIYAVDLSATGAVGTAAEIDAVTFRPNAGHQALQVVGTADGAVVWTVMDVGLTGVTSTTARWFAAEPYSGQPHELALGAGEGVRMADTSLVRTSAAADGGSVVDWIDLDSGEVASSATVRGSSVLDVHGSLVAHADPGGEQKGAWLTDVGPLATAGDPTAGDPTTGEQTTGEQATDEPEPSTEPEPGDEPAVEGPFTDVPADSPFAPEAETLVDRGVLEAYDDGTFRALWPVTRDELAELMYRVTRPGSTAAACTMAPYLDVPANHPRCGEIAWLVSTGATAGWTDLTYRSVLPVTREVMAAFLYRFTHDGAAAPACSSAPFLDVPAGSRYCGEIAWLASTGVATGWPDRTFRPAMSLQRGDMAELLYRFIDKGLVPAGA